MAAAGDDCVGLVEGEIPLRTRKCMRADVEVGHGRCAAACGVKGKAAGETKRIQHGTSGGEGFHRAPVFALIQKESGFLTVANIRFKANAVFEKDGKGIPLMPLTTTSPSPLPHSVAERR